MLYVSIGTDSWDYTSNITRESFDNYLVRMIAPFLNNSDDIAKTIITFPKTLTKPERYSIHKLSIKNDFRTISFDDQFDDRILEVTLSKVYVQNLFHGYNFQAEMAEQPEPQKTERQILLDTLLEFIHGNLNEEFQEYLLTI